MLLKDICPSFSCPSCKKWLNFFDLRTFVAKFCRENLRIFSADFFDLKSKIRRHFYFLDVWGKESSCIAFFSLMILAKVEVVRVKIKVPCQYFSVTNLMLLCWEIQRNFTSWKSVCSRKYLWGSLQDNQASTSSKLHHMPNSKPCLRKFKSNVFHSVLFFYRTCNKCVGSICFCCANCRGWSRGHTDRSLLAFQDWMWLWTGW